MRQAITGPSMPMAAICINKSRLKTYHKDKTPTFYLEKGQEFQIELFNPTSDTILAKIQLNGNHISQGGLVLRPGERVFLERYLDVAKKFKFDTYEVANTAEVRKAIEDNGDFKVEFYKESKPAYLYGGSITISTTPYTNSNTIYTSTGDNLRSFGSTTIGRASSNSLSRTNIGNTNNASYFSSTITTASADAESTTMDCLSFDDGGSPMKSLKTRSKKTIETGRVEAGSNSNQKLEYVSKSFDYFPFHTVEYKLLPISQKINSVADINVKRYCHNCGAKQKANFKFCPSCGTKI